jgi:hypothetical protein
MIPGTRFDPGPGLPKTAETCPVVFYNPSAHVNASRFMAEGNGSDVVLLELCEHRVDFRAWQTKSELYSFVGKAFDQKRSASDFSHRSLSCFIE